MHTKLNIQDLTKISLCTALLCITSYIIIPLPFTPIVISFHTIMVNIIGLILKPNDAGLTVLIYLLMGLIGLPVFSAGSAGPGKLFGPTGGFYFGFLFAVIAISMLKGKKISFLRYNFISIIIGIPIQHLFAIFFMSMHNGWNFSAAFVTVSLPFLVGDIVKCFMASMIGVSLNHVLQR